jgi:hypothetical protein
MAREQRIVETFVELADTMVEDFDVVEFLHGLAERCVELLDCAEVGVLLADAAGALRVIASSSEHSEALELLQAEMEEGPCFECYQRARAVFSEDLVAERGRWPTFAPAAVERGFGSVHAVPMRARGATLGGLNFFRARVGRITAQDLRLGQGLADMAAIALLQQRDLHGTRDVVAQLQHALNSRVLIEQAKGVLAERAGIGVDAAFLRLRTHAREHNQRLGDVARDLVEGRVEPTVLVDPKRPMTSSSGG